MTGFTIVPVTRVPGVGLIAEGLLACERCGIIPHNDGILELSLVTCPEGHKMLLGPVCTADEIKRHEVAA